MRNYMNYVKNTGETERVMLHFANATCHVSEQLCNIDERRFLYARQVTFWPPVGGVGGENKTFAKERSGNFSEG